MSDVFVYGVLQYFKPMEILRFRGVNVAAEAFLRTHYREFIDANVYTFHRVEFNGLRVKYISIDSQRFDYEDLVEITKYCAIRKYRDILRCYIDDYNSYENSINEHLNMFITAFDLGIPLKLGIRAIPINPIDASVRCAMLYGVLYEELIRKYLDQPTNYMYADIESALAYGISVDMCKKMLAIRGNIRYCQSVLPIDRSVLVYMMNINPNQFFKVAVENNYLDLIGPNTQFQMCAPTSMEMIRQIPEQYLDINAILDYAVTHCNEELYNFARARTNRKIIICINSAEIYRFLESRECSIFDIPVTCDVVHWLIKNRPECGHPRLNCITMKRYIVRNALCREDFETAKEYLNDNELYKTFTEECRFHYVNSLATYKFLFKHYPELADIREYYLSYLTVSIIQQWYSKYIRK